jgi:hypothetical protein
MIRDLDLTVRQLIISELRQQFSLIHPADYAIAFDPPTEEWAERHGLRNNQPRLQRSPDGRASTAQPAARLTSLPMQVCQPPEGADRNTA